MSHLNPIEIMLLVLLGVLLCATTIVSGRALFRRYRVHMVAVQEERELQRRMRMRRDVGRVGLGALRHVVGRERVNRVSRDVRDVRNDIQI